MKNILYRFVYILPALLALIFYFLVLNRTQLDMVLGIVGLVMIVSFLLKEIVVLKTKKK